MPPDQPDDDPHHTDKMILIECLELTENQLKIIVFKRQDLFRKEFLDYFPGPWDEVEQHFVAAKRRIDDDEINWKYVEGAGLTGTNAAWKRDLMREAAKQGVLGRFLKLANSFLGSLAGGVPGIEFIKEYKELVEACLKLIPRLA